MRPDVEKLQKDTLKKQAFRINLTRTAQVERETKALSKQRRVYVCADQMRDGRLLKLVYGSDSGLNRGERQTKRVLNQMIKNTMVNVDTVNRDEAA